MGKGYQKEYFNKVSLKNENIYKIYISFLENAKVELKNKTVLDIGCGYGIFLKMLDSTNKKYGIDISDHAIREAKKIENINFLLTNLNTIDSVVKLNDVRFDIISIFDVIEHCYNFEFLDRILNENLNIGGYLVITTPNANSILRLLGNNNYSGELDETHKILFTPYTLDFFLRRCGLIRIEVSTPYSFYFKNNIITKNILFGGQIFGIYQKSV